MRQLKRITVLMMLGACLAAAGCGSDEEGAPIPSDSATALERQLDGVQSRVDAGPEACADVTGDRDPNTRVVSQLIEGLPEDVDPDVRQALTDGFDRLWSLVDERCEELRADAEAEAEANEPDQPAPEPEPTPTETETETIPPSDTAPPETPTETVPETPEEETPAPEEPPLEGDDGGALAPEADQG